MSEISSQNLSLHKIHVSYQTNFKKKKKKKHYYNNNNKKESVESGVYSKFFTSFSRPGKALYGVVNQALMFQ